MHHLITLARALILGCTLVAASTQLLAQEHFLRGDVDDDGRVTFQDAFETFSILYRGEDHGCLAALDADDSGNLGPADLIYILQFIFLAGAAPPAPFLSCDGDPTPDGLGCATPRLACAPPPVFASEPPDLLVVGGDLRYPARARTTVGTISYALLDGPSGAILDSGSGDLSWTPQLADVGLQTFLIRAQLGSLSTDQSFDVQVVPPIEDQTLFEGAGLLLTGTLEAARVADVNNDGNPDIICLSTISFSSITVYLGNADGIFSASISFSVGDEAVDFAIGELTGDAFLDIAVPAGAGIEVFAGSGFGSFTSYVSIFIAGLGPELVEVVDVNNDDNADIVGIDTGGDLDLILNDGTGGFSSPMFLGTPSQPTAVATGLVNDDAFLDLAITFASSNSVGIYLGSATGSFSFDTGYSTPNSPQDLQLKDLDGDGELDLVVASENGQAISIRSGQSNGVFGALTTLTGGSENIFPTSIEIADLDNDGFEDLLAASPFTNEIVVFPATAPGVYGPVGRFTSGSGRTVTAVDTDGDGALDLVSSDPVIWRNNGGLDFSTSPVIAIDSSVTAVAPGDFNGDGFLDLAAPRPNDQEVAIILGNGNGSFQPFTTFPTPSTPSVIAAADFDNDQILDLAYRRANRIEMVRGIGDGTFVDQLTINGAFAP